VVEVVKERAAQEIRHQPHHHKEILGVLVVMELLHLLEVAAAVAPEEVVEILEVLAGLVFRFQQLSKIQQ
jgi:hypothetical protein